MEDAWVLPVRMCNRRDVIPPINVELGVLVRYVLTVCLPVLSICTYVINSVPVFLDLILLYNGLVELQHLAYTLCIPSGN